MKPPPRTRAKPNRHLKAEPTQQRSGKLTCKWQRVEQRKLLNALKRLSRTSRGEGDIDLAYLRKYVPTRTISEIRSVVESLKNKVISCASFKLQKTRFEEKGVRKPIEEWTHMASALAGTHEESISSAFSQMFIVSSTEPRTLRNCDPPQVHRPPKDDRPVSRTVPLRPMPCLPVQGANTARPLLLLKTPSPAMGPARRLSAPSQVVRLPNNKAWQPQHHPSPTAGTPPAATFTSQSAATSCQPGAPQHPASLTVSPATEQVTPSFNSAAVPTTLSVGSSVIQTTQQPSEQHPTTISTTCTSKSMSSSSQQHFFSSTTSLNPVPSTAPSTIALSCSATSSCSSTCPTPPLTTPATAFHSRFGRTSKYATKDSPRTFGVKCVVDFERIYRFLSVIQKPDDDCHLTPMESAIVLDLLMSLPEELHLLNCNKLHKHLIQVYRCLSAPADSKMAKEILKDMKDGLCAQTEAQRAGDLSRTNDKQDTAVTADCSDVTDSGGKKLQLHEAESQSSGSHDTSSQSQDANMMGPYPPLNPFMVPVKLLLHK